MKMKEISELRRKVDAAESLVRKINYIQSKIDSIKKLDDNNEDRMIQFNITVCDKIDIPFSVPLTGYFKEQLLRILLEVKIYYERALEEL